MTAWGLGPRRRWPSRRTREGAVSLEVGFGRRGNELRPDHLRAERRRAVHQDDGQRRRREAAGAGSLPVRRPARLLRRRYRGRCLGTLSASPGRTAQRELPAAHAARRGGHPDDRLRVSRQRHRDRPVRARRRGRSSARTSPTARSRTSGLRSSPDKGIWHQHDGRPGGCRAR